MSNPPFISATPATGSAGWPWLPVELLGSVIAEAWSSPMTARERITFFSSDVHIPCPLFAEDYLRLLRPRTSTEPNSDYLMEDASETANALCHSLTFHVDAEPLRRPAAGTPPSITLYSCRDASACAVSSTLYMLATLHHVPHLRRLAVEYVNWGFDDIFDQGRLLVVPPQVSHLALRFSFPGNEHSPLAASLRTTYARRWYSGWVMLHVRHLEVSGAPIEFVSDMIETCPALETLDIDDPAHLAALVRLPSSAHTLTLRISDRELRQEDIEKWCLDDALEKGLLAHSSSPQIVVHSGTPEVAAWRAAEKSCAKFSVRLAHRSW
ncbi:hypothetical protein B0H21DRAFT_894317 [Amylocystis lapponica]|nr:hypothetical protein B0H21DRAFT_894317 [Amylocystis lapponica]